MSAHVWGAHAFSRAGDDILVIVNFFSGSHVLLRKIVSAWTPVQRMRSNGHAFNPARESRALPGKPSPHHVA